MRKASTANGEYKDSGVQMNVAMLDAYAQLSAAVTENTGDKMYVSSVYRSVAEQAEIRQMIRN